MSADGAALYLFSHFAERQTDSLITIDPATFSRMTVVSVPFATPQPGAIVAGRAGRLYVGHVDYGSGQASVKILDVATGNAVGAALVSTDPAQFGAGLLALSPDHNTLYVAKSNKVWKIDVTTDIASVLDSSVTAYEIQAMQLSPDGARLYLGRLLATPSSVEIRDAASLTVTGQLSAPTLFDFFVTATDIFVSQASGGRPGDRYFLSGDVVRYDATSLAVVASWGFVRVPNWIVVARDGARFYTDGSGGRTLVVPFN